MANHKSAVKSHKKSVMKKEKNLSIMNRIKTFIKKVEQALTSGSDAVPAARKAESEIMKGVTKGVLNKKAASRKVSKIAKKVKDTK